MHTRYWLSVTGRDAVVMSQQSQSTVVYDVARATDVLAIVLDLKHKVSIKFALSYVP